MKLNRYIAKGLAVLFLLMLGQKFGVGLFLHNVLHVSETNKETPSSNDNAINFACNCIDDFSSPFTEVDAFEIREINNHPNNFIPFAEQQGSPSSYKFISPRAPPVKVA